MPGEAALIQRTVAPPESAIQTPPPPTVTPAGTVPTRGTLSTIAPVDGSISIRKPFTASVAQILPAPPAIPAGRPLSGRLTWDDTSPAAIHRAHGVGLKRGCRAPLAARHGQDDRRHHDGQCRAGQRGQADAGRPSPLLGLDRRQIEVELHLHHAHGLFEPLQRGSPAVDVLEPLHLARKVDDCLADQHLAGRGQRAQPGRQVDRAAPVASLDRHRLAGVDADADPQGQ